MAHGQSHTPSACLSMGGRYNSLVVSIRGGATGSKGHELILLQGAILSQTMVLSRARHDF